VTCAFADSPSPAPLYILAVWRERRSRVFLRQEENPMTALIYALSRFYDAFIEARMRQAQAAIKHHRYIQ
jgi:hypothetical protein